MKKLFGFVLFLAAGAAAVVAIPQIHTRLAASSTSWIHKAGTWAAIAYGKIADLFSKVKAA